MEIVTVIDHGRDCQPANRFLLFIVIETKEEGMKEGRGWTIHGRTNVGR